MGLPSTGIKGMGNYARLRPVFNLLNFKNWDDSSVFSVLADLCFFPRPHVKKKKKKAKTNLVSWCVLWVWKEALAGQPTLPTW